MACATPGPARPEEIAWEGTAPPKPPAREEAVYPSPMGANMRSFAILFLALVACDADKDGLSKGKGDCDDKSAAVFPGADEVCDGLDNNCDGVIDDDAIDRIAFYIDVDGDGFGDGEKSERACAAPEGYVADFGDCDDLQSDVNPGMAEACNDLDDDCDTQIDEPGATGEQSWFKDEDGDGYGDPDSSPVVACHAPTGRVADDQDCDDDAEGVNPGASEVCDPRDVDEDCDGVSDDDDDAPDPASLTDWFPDVDRDGYGDASDAGTSRCERPTDHVSDGSDCDDGDIEVHPSADELCNDLDDDCDPATLEAGRVYFEALDGTRSNETPAWALGTSAKPAAIDLTEDGTLTVCDGTWYVEFDVTANVDFVGPHGAEATLLDGADASTILEMVDGTDVSLTGLTLQKGNGDTKVFGFGTEGGAVACSGGSTLSTDSVTFEDNYGHIGGAILAMDGCDLTLVDTIFQSNSATYGGAILAYDDVSITATGTDFLTGAAVTTAGGLYLQATAADVPVTADFDDCLFSANTASYGAALAIFAYTDVTCTGTSSTTAGFYANESDTGAVYVSEATSTFTATVCDFGEEGSTKDNASSDVEDTNEETYSYGDDASFSCDSAGCE